MFGKIAFDLDTQGDALGSEFVKTFHSKAGFFLALIC